MAATPRRRAWRRWLLVPALLVAVAVAASALTPRAPNPVGHWRSAAGRAAYVEAYQEALATMPTPTRTLDVVTDFGTVRVYVWENESTRGRTPVALFPGWTSGVPMWSTNLPGLASELPVYAFDALGDAGLSTQTRPLRDNADQAAWIDQALTGLGVDRVHIAGHSFGGWLAANYAARHPQRVASLIVLDPPLVFQPLPLGVILKSIPATVPFLPQSWRDAALADIGGGPLDPADPVARMIALATQHYSPEKPAPEQLTCEQLGTIEAPTLVALAGRSFLPDAERSATVARACLRRPTVRIWTEATHSLPMEEPAEVDAAIVQYVRGA